MRTDVAIIGAGPAGLLLGHLLHQANIDFVILEQRSRDRVRSRVRAGVLEQGSVDVLAEHGLDDDLRAHGLTHHGIHLQFDGARHHLDFPELVGRTVTVYGQQQLVAHLLARHEELGTDVRFEVEGVRPVGIDGSDPAVEFDGAAGREAIHARFLGVLRDRDVAGANVVQFLVTGGLYGSFFIVTLLLQQVLGYAPMQMALSFVPLTIVTAIASIVVAPFLTARYRERTALVVGLLAFLAGALLLARVPLDGDYLADLLAPLLLLGLGIGIVLPPIMGLAMSKAGEDEVGAVSGLANSTGMIGGAFWTAVVASMIGSVAAAGGDSGAGERAALAQGLAAGSLAIAAVLVVALVVAFVVLRRRDPVAPPEPTADVPVAG